MDLSHLDKKKAERLREDMNAIAQALNISLASLATTYNINVEDLVNDFIQNYEIATLGIFMRMKGIIE